MSAWEHFSAIERSSDATLRSSMSAVFERYDAEFLQAYRIRAVEEKLLQLFREGRVYGTVHTSIGQEFSAVLLAKQLLEQDVVFSNHRCHGHYLARTGDVAGLLGEIMGKRSGVCRGIGGSQHLCAKGFFSNGIQGGIVPVSAGIALHQKLARNNGVSIVYLGDGTLGEGAVYETLNIAAKWSLPQLFVVEDNYYAQSTASSQTLAGSVAGRAAAFGVSYHKATIWDLEHLDRTMCAVVEQVRSQQAPAVFHIELYRLEAHSKGDDDRDREEIAAYHAKDPLTRYLVEREKCADTQANLQSIRAEIDGVAETAAKDDCAFDVLGRQTVQIVPNLVAVEPEAVSQRQAINSALDQFLERNPAGVLLGEDIHSPYGGAFRVCKDLSLRHPQQVLTTPISEAAIAGVANGLALMGNKVVVEIMFGDFVTLTFDQILNHAAKFRLMYGEPRAVPFVLRTPMGGGRGYGPTHSQSLEKHLAGIPGTQLFVLHGRARVGNFYSRLLSESEAPAIVIENKVLYGQRGDRELAPGYALYETDDAYPTTVLRPNAPADLTIVAFGNTSTLAEQVARELYAEDEIVAEVILPLQVYPLTVAPILAAVQRTKRVVVVEEGHCGFDLGAEVIAEIATRWSASNAPAMRRLAAKPTVIPCARPLENHVLPSAEELYGLCLDVYL